MKESLLLKSAALKKEAVPVSAVAQLRAEEAAIMRDVVTEKKLMSAKELAKGIVYTEAMVRHVFSMRLFVCVF